MVSDPDLHDRLDAVAVSRRFKNNRHFHVPGTDGRPLCGSRGEYLVKSTAVYPPGYFPWCGECERRFEVGDDE